MADHTGWYPPGQVYYPPELPNYLRSVNDLKPIVGVPKDDEVLAIHSVIHAANGLRVSGVPGMHNPSLFMKLTDHLFNVQLARYRSRYSLVTFPSDATYTPPTLPSHISVKLESVSGAPTDDEIMKAQDAIQAYQELRRVPSMFDTRLNMELSQHLFDLQMARHMRTAGESEPNFVPEATSRPVDVTRTTRYTPDPTQESTTMTNNIGTGASTVAAHQAPQPAPSIDVCDLMERSNQLAERFNQLMERSNKVVERCCQISAGQLISQTVIERFNQAFERLGQLVEQSHAPEEQSNRLTERFNQLFERFNQLLEQSNQPAQKANELAERSNELGARANQLAAKLSQASERSNQLSEQSLEQAIKSQKVYAGLLTNINRVLVGIQHAIVRNHKNNTIHAIDCLVNEKGEKSRFFTAAYRSIIRQRSERHPVTEDIYNLSIMVDDVPRGCWIPDEAIGTFLRFYGIYDQLDGNPTSSNIEEGKLAEAREILSDYLSSSLG